MCWNWEPFVWLDHSLLRVWYVLIERGKFFLAAMDNTWTNTMGLLILPVICSSNQSMVLCILHKVYLAAEHLAGESNILADYLRQFSEAWVVLDGSSSTRHLLQLGLAPCRLVCFKVQQKVSSPFTQPPATYTLPKLLSWQLSFSTLLILSFLSSFMPPLHLNSTPMNA